MNQGDYHNPVTVLEGAGVLEKTVDEFKNSNVTVITTRGTRQRFLDNFLGKNNLKPLRVIDECIENPTFSSC